MGIVSGERIFKFAAGTGRDAAPALRDARLKAKMTLDAAADLVGLHPNTLSRIERGLQRFFTLPVKEKLEKLSGAMLAPGLIRFEETSWGGVVTQLHQKRRTKKRSTFDERSALIAEEARKNFDDRVRRLTERMDHVRSIVAAWKRDTLPAETALGILALVVEVTQ
jgi:transcriptional regulator with XRE-family HTH domain